MSRDYVPIENEGRRRPMLRTALIVGAIAFLAGLIAMGYAMKNYDRWFDWSSSSTTTRPARSQTTNAVPQDATLATTVPGTPPGNDLDALSAREAALAARLADLEARTANIDNKAQAASGNATRAEGLLVAFAARRALDRGLGLGYIEGQLRERFGATQPRSVATVVQASRAPVTIEDLRLGFASISPQLVTGAARDGWWQSFKREISNLIVLRKEGSTSPRPSDRLARAQRMLEGGQVEAALAEVSRLPGAAKVNPWTTAARRYIDARHALDVIETAAILGQGSQTPPISGTNPAPTPPTFEVVEPDTVTPATPQ